MIIAQAALHVAAFFCAAESVEPALRTDVQTAAYKLVAQVVADTIRGIISGSKYQMAYVIVIPDGAADEPIPELEGRTPLEAADTPHIDWIAVHGRQGCAVTIPKGFLPGSDVATLSLFGYSPKRYYTGRAPLEAVARGVVIDPGQIVFRCNFVTIIDGVMEDFTAGHISQVESERLIEDLNRAQIDDGVRFHAGLSYRSLAVVSDAESLSVTCTPPHDIPGERVAGHWPRGAGAERLKMVMAAGHDLLAGHEVNLVKRDLRESAATDIWLWGQGRPIEMESFASRFGCSGVVIAAVDLIRGIAISAGMDVLDVPGATGFLDTDYAAKGRAAVEAVETHDLVVVHIEAPDEAGHLGDLDAKVRALEQIDRHIVGPLLEKLREQEKWKILIAPDHPTPVRSRVHTSTPPPFCMAGDSVPSVAARTFSESAAAAGDMQIDPAHELMEFFLRG